MVIRIVKNVIVFFCAYEENGERVVNEYLSIIQGLNEYEIIKNGGKYPLFVCPDCGKNSFILVDGKYMCFSCGMYYCEEEVAFCDKCGRIYLNKDEYLGICSSCIEYKMKE